MIWVEIGAKTPNFLRDQKDQNGCHVPENHETNTFQHGGDRISCTATLSLYQACRIHQLKKRHKNPGSRKQKSIRKKKSSMSKLQICKALKKVKQLEMYVYNISKTYTPCAHKTNSSSSSPATQLGESLIQLAHMESCSAASRRIRPSPKRYGENVVET